MSLSAQHAGRVMRAAILFEPNTPLRVVDAVLDSPRTGEVAVRIVASGVCHTCLHVMRGSIAGIALPAVLGDEAAGVIEEIGPGVTSVSPGDHVIVSWAPSCGRCRQCALGRPALCERRPPQGRLADGTVRIHADGQDVYHFGPATYASATILPESCVVPVRRDMPLDVAALIGCSVTTGVGAVIRTAQATPGSSVAVFGCGGVGLNAVQGARLIGAHPVIAIDIAPWKLELAERLGATSLIDGSQHDVASSLRAQHPNGVDVAVVTIGRADVIVQAWASLAPRGTCVIVGRLQAGETVSLDPEQLYGKETRLVGSRYGSSRPFDDFPMLVELYMAGKLFLDELVTQRYPLDDANEAHRALAAGELARGLLIP